MGSVVAFLDGFSRGFLRGFLRGSEGLYRFVKAFLDGMVLEKKPNM